MLNEAIEVGTPVLRARRAINRRPARGVFAELEQLVEQPTTKITLQRLEETFDVAQPAGRDVAPAQTVCNYWNYWFTFLPTRSPTATRSASPACRRRVPPDATLGLRRHPARAGEVETPARRLLGRAGQRQGRLAGDPGGGEFEPYELPILNAQPLRRRPGRRNADCQAGQFGYALGAAAGPRPGADNPAIGVSDLPARAARRRCSSTQDGDRAARDTRIDRASRDLGGTQ